MCYPKPGARCSAHTRAALHSATLKVRAAEARLAGATPAEETKFRSRLAEAREKQEEARQEWLASPEGIRWARKKFHELRETDPAAALGYADLAKAKREERMASIAAWRETEAAKTGEAEPRLVWEERDDRVLAQRQPDGSLLYQWQSSSDVEDYDQSTRQWFSSVEEARADLADVHAAMSEWYDEHGFAPETENSSLVHTHTGAGENYLLAQGYTERNGWSTENPWGDALTPISVRVDGEYVSDWDVRRVLLCHEDGRTAEVFCLDDGGSGYSTYGSYEECVKVLRDNVGEIVAQADVA